METTHIGPLVQKVPTMLSPSRVNFVLKCPLRGLYDHYDNQAYRNTGFTGYASLGNVIHKVFKLSSEQRPGASVDFDAVWNRCEQEMGMGNLKTAVPNYGKLKFLTRSQVTKFPRSKIGARASGAYVIPETKIIDKYLGLQGQPDLIIFRESKPYEIKDYKTGKVFETDPYLPEEELDFESVKQDFKNQLYLYAYLVKSRYGNYPDYLTVVQPGGREVKAVCDSDAIEALVHELANCKKNLAEMTAAELAVPSDENCRYCPFKPGCPWHQVRNDEVLTDLSGIVKRAVVHSYGNFSIEFTDGEKFFYKEPFCSIASDINDLVGKEIFITSVREEIPEKKMFTPVNKSILYIKIGV